MPMDTVGAVGVPHHESPSTYLVYYIHVCNVLELVIGYMCFKFPACFYFRF